jgi:hypothetical protein
MDASPASRDLSIENPRLRSPVSAARVVCGSHPVALTSASIVAPPFALSISVISACFDPARGTLAFGGGGFDGEPFESSPLPSDGERDPLFPSERDGRVASFSPSSKPIESRPARVIIRLIERPFSSCRQTGMPGFERNSRISLRAVRVAPTYNAAALFVFGGTTAIPSARAAAPESMIS